MATWDPTKAKAQIRLTAYRLAQLQERHDQISNITKRDVATLITQGDIVIAKRKVEKLVRDDRLSTLIEGLEQYCNVLLERFAELDHSADFESDSPVLEAVSSIMMVAARTELKDVIILRDILELRYGPEFTRLAVQNHGNYIPPQFIDILSDRPPSSAQVDVYIDTIAKENHISWTAPLLPHQKAHALSGSLDVMGLPRTVDLDELRQICSRGIPQQPPWLRPRIWKLLLGTLPPQKDAWEIEAHTKRQSYYELARRLLAPIGSLPPPTTPLSPLDASLLNLAKSLPPLPHELDEDIEASPLCPFDDSAPEGLKIDTASAVDQRLQMIQRQVAGVGGTVGTLEASMDDSFSRAPQISVSSPTDTPSDENVPRKAGTLLHTPASTRNHLSSLLRLLFIHTALHPSTPASYLTSLLVPLYVAMVQEIEPAELAHVEADSFWLFTELWGEVGELARDEGSQEWMAKFGRRLAWADSELWEDLCSKGLDPTLPHYSYRWLAPLLTRTLSLPSVLTIWDAMFTQPSRTSDHNAKLEFLLDICTSMLIHARVRLFRLGKLLTKSPGLWGDMTVTSSSSTPIHFEEAFIQGMALLQHYPMEELGGPERVIEIALGLVIQRDQRTHKPAAAAGLGERLRGSVWNGFMTRALPIGQPNPQPESESESDGTPSPDWPDSGAEDDGDATETPGRALLGKLGNTVWRGITNQSSMEGPPSPLPPTSPVQPVSPLHPASPVPLPPPPGISDVSSSNSAMPGTKGLGSRLSNSIWRGLTNQSAMDSPPSPTEPSMPSLSRLEIEDVSSPTSSTGLWIYTEKFKDSDAAAALSKAGTNWTAKAATLWRRSNPSSTVSSPEYPSHHSRQGSLNMTGKSWTEMFPKRGSLPGNYTKEYSSPPRPNFRESRYFSPDEQAAPGSPSRPIVGLPSPPDLLIKSKSALASLTGTNQAPPSKTGPRPLLLNSSSLITPSNPHRLSRSPTPVTRSPQPQRDSMSSVSSSTSTSLTAARQSTYSDRDSESGSAGRFVPLRRGASPRLPPSPQSDVARSSARVRTAQHLSPGNESEPSHGTSSSSRNLERRTSSEESVRRGWGRVELPDSPSTLPSSPPPKTPTFFTEGTSIRVNGGAERQRGSVVLRESGDQAQTHPIERKLGRKKSWNAAVLPTAQLEDTSESSTSQEDGPRLRTKRYARPANLRLKSDPDLRSTPSAIVEQKNSGNPPSLMPENLDAMVTTPRASDFPSPGSGSPGRSSRVRKDSRSPRRPHRKTDMQKKGSGGEEGDDEGYDDFLSAYESEDGARVAGA